MNRIDKEIISEIDTLFVKSEERKNLVNERILNEIIKKNCDLKDISITELHVISCIGNEEEINGIKISEKIGMTRGGVSKVISSLIKKELITSYKDDVNKKKIFYKLTPLGEMINEIHNDKHEERNRKLINRVNKYTEQEKETILKFIKDIQNFLSE
ncbi:MarR family winged helix-turn-helix transcriptional regulator [Terrisporobacter sp.]|uniref:MarR family winged helix-turn-helix transcriptional regulator n=1 Tax=Terrisporobacter sp. TaxID=1965305 RepID=UPI00260D3652|nr:MarR family transcriptional regulator [Terrisporobacter sp.]